MWSVCVLDLVSHTERVWAPIHPPRSAYCRVVRQLQSRLTIEWHPSPSLRLTLIIIIMIMIIIVFF
jgi:hypothetical protein